MLGGGDRDLPRVVEEAGAVIGNIADDQIKQGDHEAIKSLTIKSLEQGDHEATPHGTQ